VSAHPELAAGVIHDIGYRRYEGQRLGRVPAMRAVYVQTLRGLYGLGRPARAKVVPFLLFAITVAPGIVSGALTAVAPIAPIPYLHYPYYLQLAIVVFVAAQTPQVVTGDIRFRVLSLYFARPLERADYVWAELGAIATGLFLLMAAPLLAIYAAVLLAHTHQASDVIDETGPLLLGLAGVALHAALLAGLGMVISALTRVRAFAVVGIVGVYLTTSAIAAIVGGVAHGSDVGAAFGVISPFSLIDGFQAWAFGRGAATPLEPGHLGWLYAAVLAGALLLSAAFLLWRYRRIEP
jgi:ABC-2 type transport system permease protein